jgi:hypothetical protein
MKEKPSTSLVPAAGPIDSLALLKKAIEESPEILTGVLGTLIPGALLPARLFHAGLKGQFAKQLTVELEEFRKKGQINEDYLKSEPAAACFSDLLDFIDRISPDPERYKAIREAFLRTMRRGEMGKGAVYAQQLLRIVYELSAGEIVVLATVYKMGSGGEVTASFWLNDVANRSNILRSEIVEGIERSLMEKRLILPRSTESAKSRPDFDYPYIKIWGQRNRLTILGQEVCELIQREPDK